MPLFLSHVAVKIQGLCLVYIVYGAKTSLEHFFKSLRSHLDIKNLENLQNVFGIITVNSRNILQRFSKFSYKLLYPKKKFQSFLNQFPKIFKVSIKKKLKIFIKSSRNLFKNSRKDFKKFSKFS